MIDSEFVNYSDMKYCNKALNIIKANDISLQFISNFLESAANTMTRQICGFPVVGKCTNLILMHEIGHILNPNKMIFEDLMEAKLFNCPVAYLKIVESETMAWDWAKANNQWDDESEDFMNRSINAYRYKNSTYVFPLKQKIVKEIQQNHDLYMRCKNEIPVI